MLLLVSEALLYVPHHVKYPENFLLAHLLPCHMLDASPFLVLLFCVCQNLILLDNKVNWNSHLAMMCETTGELLGFQSKERVGACNWVCWPDCGFIRLEKTFKVSSFFCQSHVLPLYPLPLFLSVYMWLTWLILWPVPTYRMEVSSYSLGWTGTSACHSCSVHYWLCRLISDLTRYWNLWFITIRWDKSPKVYVFCLLRSLKFQA